MSIQKVCSHCGHVLEPTKIPPSIIWVSWVTTSLSLIGNIFIIYKSYWGFVIWLIANTSWTILAIKRRDYAQTFLFIIYNAFALWGLINWFSIK